MNSKHEQVAINMESPISNLRTKILQYMMDLAFYKQSRSAIYEPHIKLYEAIIEEHQKAIEVLENYQRAMQWEDN